MAHQLSLLYNATSREVPTQDTVFQPSALRQDDLSCRVRLPLACSSLDTAIDSGTVDVEAPLSSLSSQLPMNPHHALGGASGASSSRPTPTQWRSYCQGRLLPQPTVGDSIPSELSVPRSTATATADASGIPRRTASQQRHLRFFDREALMPSSTDVSAESADISARSPVDHQAYRSFLVMEPLDHPTASMSANDAGISPPVQSSGEEGDKEEAEGQFMYL